MIRNDTVCHFAVAFIRHPCEFFRRMNDWQKQICIEVCLAILDQRHQTFQSHACINVLLRQFTVFFPIEFGIAVKL